LVVLSFLVTLGLPLTAAASGVELRLGAFFPRAESTLFDDTSELFTADRDDWTEFSGGLEYTFRVAPKIHLGLHVDGYQETLHTSYRDFTFESGREITQSLKLSVVPLGASIRFVPIDRKGAITPYISVGPDVIFYEYEEFGDFIDFDTADFTGADVINDAFFSEGAAFGFHVSGGVRIPLNRDWSVLGEGRYQWAEDDMGDDFRGSGLDLSGFSGYFGIRLDF
jgi:hypothetical protein